MRLSLIDFTRTVVTNSRMLKKGGRIGLGRFDRTRKNVILSPNLIAHQEWVAEHVSKECSLNDTCIPKNMSSAAIGQPVPGSPGKLYVNCTDEERSTRMQNARDCSTRILSTKGGIYGGA